MMFMFDTVDSKYMLLPSSKQNIFFISLKPVARRKGHLEQIPSPIPNA